MQQSKSPQPPSTLSKSILKSIYVIHLIAIAAFTAYILISSPAVISPSITFAMLLIYGFMGAWVLVAAFLLVLCQAHQKATIFSRIFVKLVLFCFPIFGLLSISKDHELDNQSVRIFILYMGAVCLLVLLYEFITCVCYDDKRPEFLFASNDLTNANAEVLQKRKEYNDLVSSL